MTTNTIDWNSICADILADPDVKAEYDALESEFNIAAQVIALRKASGLNQRDFAERIGIKQPQVARIESGKQLPKLETLTKLASGADYAVEIHFVPIDDKQVPRVSPVQVPTNLGSSEKRKQS